jgi:hypothetical protein
VSPRTEACSEIVETDSMRDPADTASTWYLCWHDGLFGVNKCLVRRITPVGESFSQSVSA